MITYKMKLLFKVILLAFLMIASAQFNLFKKEPGYLVANILNSISNVFLS